jgi:CelD/BcsL family acetyltransferase involved in cellulose biosynthesis
MNRWTVVPLERSLGSHAAAWDELNSNEFNSHPMLTSLFVDGLLRHFSDGREHLCMLQGETAVLAMCIVRPLSGLRWASFAPAQGQVAATLVPHPDMLGTLVESLPGKVFQLDLLSNDPQVGGVLRDAVPPTHRQAHALTMRIALEGSFESYWSARPRQLPSNIRRYERRLQADGLEPRMARITAPHAMVAAVERYAQLEGAGWKGRHGTALGSTREQYDFYRNLMLQAAERGQAVVYELWLNDKLAASRLALYHGAMLVMLKTSYDESFAQYAPGRLLLRTVIEDAFALLPGGAIEFCTDASVDQLAWATDHRWVQHLSLYRNRLADVAINALKAWRGGRHVDARRGDDRRSAHARGVIERRASCTVDVFTHPDALPDDVRQFMDRAEVHNIEFGFAWYRNLVATVFPQHNGVRLYALRRDGKIVAVMPLRAERGRFAWRVSSLSNFYTTLYEPVLAPSLKAVDLMPLLGAVRRDFPRLASLTLTPMAPGSHAHLVLLEALANDRWLPFEFFAFGNWYEPVKTNWTGYLAARGGTLRSTIKRMGKKFAADGGVLEVVTRPENLAEAIAAYEKVYAASWKNPEPFPGFMPGLLRTCAEKGTLRLGLAWLNGHAIAAQAWIVSHGKAEIYKVAYDQAYKAYAPGTLVTATLMEHVIEIDRVSEIDYLMGDDPYKKTWMSNRRERWGIVAYNLRSLPGMAGLAYEALGRTAKYISQMARRVRRVPTARPAPSQAKAPAARPVPGQPKARAAQPAPAQAKAPAAQT